MSVIQHKSIIGTTQNVSLTLDSPVTEGNLLIAVVLPSTFNNVNSLEDASAPSSSGWSQFSFGFVSGDLHDLYVFSSSAQTSESYTLEVLFSSDDGLAKHIHLYEVSGYDTPDQTGQSVQVTSTPSASITGNTNRAKEFVLAVFADLTHVGETFTAGTGYTAGETTNASGGSMFSEYQEISSIGQPSAAATMNTPASDQFLSVVVTFYLSSDSNGGSGGSGGGTSSLPFLGSVRVLGSAPSGQSNPFMGTIKVISSPPSGVPNPYLGSVVLGAPGPNNSNPTLGEVVVVSEAPIESDPFLGTASEG
jgi:hypothetical protein